MNDEWNEQRRLDHADGSAPPDRSSMPVLGPDSHLDDEVLAGYLDDADALAPGVRAIVELHLAACGDCRHTLAELRAVVVALSALPDIEPRRSFAVTPAMVGQRERLTTVVSEGESDAPIDMRRTPAWHNRQMRAVSWATVAAAILFVFVLSADITTNRFFQTTDGRDTMVMSNQGSEPPSMAAPESLQAQEEPEAAEDASGAAGASEEMRTTVQEDSSGEADMAQDTQTVSGEVDGSGKEEALRYQDGAADDEAGVQADDDRRSMSTPQHYWRLAQVGLAMMIVWGLAAMIALPRIRSARRRA